MRGPISSELSTRLAEAGVDVAADFDPAQAWARLHARFGNRATLIDRYALEAAARGGAVEDLDSDTRQRLAAETVRAAFPGFAWVADSRMSRDPIEVVAYDPAWAARFRDVRSRLLDALGPVALRIDHVGSTSVPGLAAKPVVDIQVSVPDLADESAYVSGVESIGVALRSRDDLHRYFRPPEGTPRRTQVHVCAAGSAWERDHLLFSSFLRAHPERAAEYARLKRSLALRFRDDRMAYTDAKTMFILDTLDAANAWAARVAWTVASASA